jgi:virginiamycin B lyase
MEGGPARVAGFVLFSVLISATGESAGVFREHAVPTPASIPAAIIHDGFDVWFTELEGNKIGRMNRDLGGVITEYAIPTPNSGPTSVVMKPLGTVREVWFTESRGNKIGRLTQTGVLTEYPLPNPASGPRDIDLDLWFTEFDGNRIGRITQDGTITEFAIPTPASGPSGIAVGPDGNHWFTEFHANKIGRITPAGIVTEFPIPTPDSGPLEIAHVGGNLWFTESTANKIGRITPEGVITEFALPTPNAGPTGIALGPDLDVWFTEAGANQLGRITRNGIVTEYRIPTPGGTPLGLSRDRLGIWFTESATNKIGYLIRDVLVVVGAGYAPPWDTDLEFANAEPYPLSVFVGSFPEFPQVCAGQCPGTGALIPPSGTATSSGRLANNNRRFVGTNYVVPLNGVDPPTLQARIVNRDRPMQSTELPVVRLSTIAAMNPVVLSFPSATRGPAARTNLILTRLNQPGQVSGLMEAFSPSGELLGSQPFALTNNVGEIFLYDVLATLGVAALENGQIRVTKTGGDGLMWGLLAAVYDDGRLALLAPTAVGQEPVDDELIVVGAGTLGTWDTEFRLANVRSHAVTVAIASVGYATPCPNGDCGPSFSVTLPRNGSARVRASEVFTIHAGVGTVRFWTASPTDLPAIRARTFDRANPGRNADLPVARLSALRRLEPKVLAFPGAFRGNGRHSNLVLAWMDFDRSCAGHVELFSPTGELVGGFPFELPPQSTAFFHDVLGRIRLRAEELNGQIAVTTACDDGLVWGAMATVYDDGSVSVSLGKNP